MDWSVLRTHPQEAVHMSPLQMRPEALSQSSLGFSNCLLNHSKFKNRHN